MNPRKIELRAPLSGVLVPLEQVPDPVFAQKMVGDGVCIDPTSNRLVSPCDGEVAVMHPAGHAVTIVTPEGIEVLMHVGLDTVALKGRGFSPTVRRGQLVKTGDLLLEFDADLLATQARSLLTLVVITNGERVARLEPATGLVSSLRDVILTVTLHEQRSAVAAEGSEIVSEPLVVPNPAGLHARPAAAFVTVAKRFKAELTVRKGTQVANGRSVVSLLSLEVGRGDSIRIAAKGVDALEALQALAAAVTAGLGEEPATAGPVPEPSTAPPRRGIGADLNLLVGVGASPGLAVGNVVQVRSERVRVIENGTDPQSERRALDSALVQAHVQIEALTSRLRHANEGGKAAIFAAHLELLEDPELLSLVHGAVAKGKSAAFSWQQAVHHQAETLSKLKNELLAARANDLRDVGQRVLMILSGAPSERPEYPASSILVAEELTPSDTAALDRSRVLGFCTTRGGSTSHVAILARSLGIPAIAGIDPRALEIGPGRPVILDGDEGTLRCDPPTEEIARIHALQQKAAVRRESDLTRAAEAARTIDGHGVEVAANIGGVRDAEEAMALGADGVGLLRSEFLFLERTSAPSEAEQADVYVRVARAVGPDRPVVIRTLDVGGDKPLSYLPIPREENPFLGQRGIRVSLDRPDVFRVQVRALLKAAREGRVLVMLPMVASLAEFHEARAIVEEERHRLQAPPLPLGIMVEVPSTALTAELFAREAEFFSIGTNDLTQYTLAMDRGHPKLAPRVDGLAPSVLRLIDLTVTAAHRHGRWVGVCGGLAGDIRAVPILVGLGVDELSVSVPIIPTVKAVIRRLSFGRCQDLARRALEAGSAAEVRRMTADLCETVTV